MAIQDSKNEKIRIQNTNLIWLSQLVDINFNTANTILDIQDSLSSVLNELSSIRVLCWW